jgi:hypothetical protein
MPEGRDFSGIPRHRWEDNIKVDLRIKVRESVEWIQSRDRYRAFVKKSMNFRVPKKGEKFLRSAQWS